MKNLRRVGLPIVAYFALTGLALHLAVVAIWLLRPDLAMEARQVVFPRIAALLGIAAPLPKQFSQLTLEDVLDVVPAWKPLPATALSPAPQTLRIGGHVYWSVPKALSALKAGETLDIGPGVYNAPVVIAPNNITIRGHGHVVFEKATAEGKANMVIRGNDVKVRNLECRFIAVSDGNGACVRLEGKNLFLDHVYFHNTQMGLLTVPEPGLVYIRDSRFELSFSETQWAHGIYIGGGELLAEDSQFLAAEHEGHEIKSRAETTTIRRCIVASLDAVDSRLIDVPDDGTLTVEDSLLAQGPNSSNWDAIALGMEWRRWPNDRVTLRNNLILLERIGVNRLLHLRENAKTEVDVVDNVIVSAEPTPYDADNIRFKSREDAGLPKYPWLPVRRFLHQ